MTIDKSRMEMYPDFQSLQDYLLEMVSKAFFVIISRKDCTDQISDSPPLEGTNPHFRTVLMDILSSWQKLIPYAHVVLVI